MNAVKEYRDFEIRIYRGEGGYRAHVVRSPAGDGSVSFIPPFERGSLNQLRIAMQQAIRNSCRDVGAPTSFQAFTTGALAKDIGAELYRSLFWGKVKELLDGSLAACSTPERGLRIKLRFDLTDQECAWLGELPWELLRHPQGPTFMSLDPQTPVVRYLESAGLQPLVDFAAPLRVLAVAANPMGTHGLDLEAERRKLEEVAGDRSKIEVTFLPNASLSGLVAQLQSGEFHVLHFMGHGSFDALTQRAVLLFERAGGYSEPVNGEVLANNLRGNHSLRLAVLNACHSGEQPGPDIHDPFSGVATTLVQAGLPAVVAMRTRISDQGAIAFSKSLYSSLVQGDPIDAAVTLARKAVSPDCLASLEWSVPLLFLRVSDGRLFSTAEPSPANSQMAMVDSPPRLPEPTTFVNARFGSTVVHGDLVVGTQNKRSKT